MATVTLWMTFVCLCISLSSNLSGSLYADDSRENPPTVAARTAEPTTSITEGVSVRTFLAGVRKKNEEK
jgi:hypothetical protein